MSNNTSNATGQTQGDQTGSPQAQGADSTSQGEQSTPEALQQQLAEARAKLAVLEEEAFKNREKARIKKQQDEAAEAERQRQLKEQGEHKVLAEQLQKTVDDLKAQITQRDQEIAQRTLESLRVRIAAKYGLPQELAARLVGQTEEELDADAQTLKKLTGGPVVYPGNGPNPKPAGSHQQQANVDELRQRYRSTGKYSF